MPSFDQESRYVSAKFHIEVDIDGIIFDDEVVGCSATFGLNSIPTASATIACGINVRTGKPSRIHDQLDNLKPRTKATIKLSITPVGGRIEKSPRGTKVIFEGYYIGVGMQRSNTNANYLLHFVHWLDDLNCGSILNGNFYPGMPADLAQAATITAINTAPNAMGSPIGVVDNNGELVNIGHLTSDLWGDVLKPLFKNVSALLHPASQGCLGEDDDHEIADKALEKMPGDAPRPGKLPMALDGIDSELIAMNVNKGLSDLIYSNAGYNSFWSKLVGEMAPSFLFGVSPGVTFANVIPFFGGLKIDENTAWRTIHLNDYNYANFNSNMQQIIESVNVYYAFTGNSNLHGGRLPGDPMMSYCNPVGYYPDPGDRDLRGVIMVKELPHWLHNTTGLELYSLEALMPKVDTHKPGEGETTPTGPIKKRPPTTVEDHKTVAKKFCEHWYKTMVLGQRYGEFSGKLRFDIAPGSMLAIEVPPSPPPINPVPDNENSPKHLFASVTQVSYNINAEQHTAGTSFTITNIRNKAENENGKLTADLPPLYTEKWVGGPLAKESDGETKI